MRSEGNPILLPSLVRNCFPFTKCSDEEVLEWVAQNLPQAAVRGCRGESGRVDGGRGRYGRLLGFTIVDSGLTE